MSRCTPKSNGLLTMKVVGKLRDIFVVAPTPFLRDDTNCQKVSLNTDVDGIGWHLSQPGVYRKTTSRRGSRSKPQTITSPTYPG